MPDFPAPHLMQECGAWLPPTPLNEGGAGGSAITDEGEDSVSSAGMTEYRFFKSLNLEAF